MMKKYALILLAFAVSVSVAGCTVSQASDRDQYGNYLSELNNGNADFNSARAQYDAAMKSYDGGIFYDAIHSMSYASDMYGSAMGHYGEMAKNASSPDQKAYAEALKSYAESCKYAALAYTEAYIAYQSGDRYRGDAQIKSAADFVTQANQYHDKAVRLQPTAIV
jgi:hypothetical protein